MTSSEEKAIRRGFLTTAILCLGIVLACLYLIGCASGVLYRPNCADKTLFVVETLAKRKPGMETKIFIGPTTISQAGHAQPQAKIGNKWMWVKVNEFGVFEYSDKPDWFFKPDREVTREWLNNFVMNEPK